MKSRKFFLPVLLCAIPIAVITFGFTKMAKKDHWKPLFNGKDLSGWDTYLGPDLDDNGKPIGNVPVGLNNDPRHVFTVINDNGEKVIRISGENWGAISTKKEYENYHLQLQFKWGELLWGQKKGKKKDSGLLYHSVGPYGADYGAWMRSQEFQIEQGNCGDYWGCAGAMADIPVIKRPDSNYVYNAQGTLTKFSAANKTGRHCVKQGDAENPTGQWNTLDLYCYGDTSIQVMNGKVMMILYHNSQMDNGRVSPLTKGKIQIQSEGSEVFYKEIKIEAIEGLPAGLARN
jgi:3-keto-disaccharide hydrolase